VTRKILITSAAALLAGTVLAAGQEGQRNPGGAQPGAAQEHQAPGAKSQEAPGAKPQGQRQQGSPAQPRAQERSQGQSQGQPPSTTGQGQREEGQAPTQRREEQDNKKGPDRAQGQHERREQGQNQRDQDRREGREDRRDRTQGQNDRDRNRRDEGREDRNDRRQGQDSRDNRDRTQGQGPGRPGASASVTFTTEQRTRIRETVLTGGHANRVERINFSISVGVAVPRTVHLVAVPSVIVEYHPAWRGFLYFVYEDEIIIVDPRSHNIVAVIDV
jgi:Protein of unknown function (DUF1236)